MRAKGKPLEILPTAQRVWGAGLNVGVGIILPRVPAIYPRKTSFLAQRMRITCDAYRPSGPTTTTLRLQESLKKQPKSNSENGTVTRRRSGEVGLQRIRHLDGAHGVSENKRIRA